MGLAYPKFKPLIAALFFVYIGAHLLQAGIRSGFLGSIRFEFLVGTSLLALALAYKTPIKYPKQPISGYLVFFLICMAIQVPLSVDVQHSWNIFVDRVLKFSAMAIFIAKFVDNPRMLLVFLAAFLLSCFKMGQEGLLGQITGSLVWQNQGVMRLHGATPNYRHPNSFAGMAIGTLPFIYYLFPLCNKYLKMFLLALFAFAINIVVFSGSRTAYVAMMAFLGYVFYRSQYKLKASLVMVLVLIGAVVYMPDQYVARFESIFTGEEAEGDSDGKRLEILADAVEILADNPLGVGVAAFPIVRKQVFGRTQDTHNLYFEVATNLGIQGLIAFLLLITAIMKVLADNRQSLQKQLEKIDRIKVEKDSERDELVTAHKRNLELFIAVSKAITLYLIIRLVLGVFGMDMYEIYWWIVIGFVFALSKLVYISQSQTKALLEAESPESNDKAPGSQRKPRPKRT